MIEGCWLLQEGCGDGPGCPGEDDRYSVEFPKQPCRAKSRVRCHGASGSLADLDSREFRVARFAAELIAPQNVVRSHTSTIRIENLSDFKPDG